MTHTSAGLKLYGYQLSTFDNQLKVAYSQIVFHFALNLPKKGAKSLFWVFSLYTCIVRTIVLGTFLGDLSQNKNKLSEFKPSLWNLFTRNSINWNRYASKHLRAATAAPRRRHYELDSSFNAYLISSNFVSTFSARLFISWKARNSYSIAPAS